jgi:hypothetical protein
MDVALSLDPSAIAQLDTNNDSVVPARLRVVDDHGLLIERAASLRIKGGEGSRRALNEKPAFRIVFAKGEDVFGLDGFTLNNMVQDHTMVHEALGYAFYDALGVPVPRTGYARVAINGQPYGLYLNLESIEKSFLMRRFGDADGILYEAAYGVDLRESDIDRFQLHVGHDPDRAQLRALVQAIATPGDAVFYGDHPLVDRRAFLRMTAGEGILEDWDSYYRSNNYRIYWIPSAAHWVFIPTGIDQTFVSNSTPVFGATGLLFQKCLASERCTREFDATVGEVLHQFEHMSLAARLDETLRLIGSASDADLRRPYDAERMHGARDRLRGFLARRPAEVRSALACVNEERAGTTGACAGVIVKRAANECLEVVPSESDDETGACGVRGMHGDTQRAMACGPGLGWHSAFTGQ